MDREPEATSSFLRRVARSGVWNAIGFIASSAGAFIISIAVARTTGPQGFGRFSYLTWLMRIFGTLLAFGIPAALARFIPEALGSGDTARARRIWKLVGATSFLLALVAAAAMAATASSKGATRLVIIAVGVGCGATLLVKVMEGFLQGARRFRQIAIIITIVSAIQSAAIVIAAYMGANPDEMIAIFGASFALSAGVMFFAVQRQTMRWTGEASPAPMRPVIKFALLLGFVTLIDEVVYGRPEIFFLDRFGTDADIGFYNAGLKFASLVIVLPAVVSKSLLPEFSFMRGEGSNDRFEEVFPVLCRLVAFLAVGLAVIGAAFSDLLILAFYGPDFDRAVPTTAVLLAGSMFGGVAGPVAAALFAGSRESMFVKAGLVLVVLNIGLDALLIPVYGLHGAAAATVASQAIGIGIGFFLAMVKAKLPYPMADALKLLGFALIASAVGRLLILPLGGSLITLVLGAAIASAGYLALSSRNGIVTVGQLRDLARRSKPA